MSNTLYNRTSWTTQHALSLDHLPIITTINIPHDYRLQQNRRTFTNYKKSDWTQFIEDTESAFAQTTIRTNIHTANIIFTNIILMTDKHNIPKGKMHSNCRLLPEDIVCNITQRNNIRRANTCDPALLNEEITSDIQKHKHIHIHTNQKAATENFPGKIIKFIANYIKGRKAYTTYRNHTSKQRQFKGGVRSPTLFNIYTSDLLPPCAPVQVMGYADDITITSTHTSTSAAKKYIQPYLHKVFPGQNKTTFY